MTQRPAKPTIAELRAICQPASVTGRSNSEHWVADLYLRKLSSLSHKTPFKNSGHCKWRYLFDDYDGVSISLALQISGFLGLLLAFFLAQLQMLWIAVMAK